MKRARSAHPPSWCLGGSNRRRRRRAARQTDSRGQRAGAKLAPDLETKQERHPAAPPPVDGRSAAGGVIKRGRREAPPSCPERLNGRVPEEDCRRLARARREG